MKADSPKKRYLTEIRHVREVGLTGDADLAYWRRMLAKEQLAPYALDGRAALLLNAVELRWWGVVFREMIVALRVVDETDPDAEAYFLLQAYNTNQLLALSERVFFDTPYDPGDIAMNPHEPVFFRAGAAQGIRIDAERLSRAPADSIDSVFEGKIFVPGGKYYDARLSARIAHASFDVDRDRFEVWPISGVSIAGHLGESGFRPGAWRVTREGFHARSATFRRNR